MRRVGARARLGSSILALILVILGAARGVEPVAIWFYQLAWFPLLVAADAGLALRGTEERLFDRPGFTVSLFLWSAPAWFLFEAANLRLANWYYVFLPASATARWVGASLAFTTVLPALFLAYRWLDELGLGRRWQGAPFEVRSGHLHLLWALGLAFVAASLWLPGVFFPLIWGAATLLLEPGNHRRAPERSLFGDISRGRYGRVARLLAAGLIVGVVWELLNSFAAARWVYTVPGLERAKLFEMPLPGFLGFPVLALDAFVLYQALALRGLAVAGWHRDDGSERREPARDRIRSGRLLVAAPLAAAFCLATLAGMDRFTVDSWRPNVSDLPGGSSELAAELRKHGLGSVRRVADADAARVSEVAALSLEQAERIVAGARLAQLRGIGAEHARALTAAGIDTVCSLASADVAQVAEIVRRADPRPRAGYRPRVRVWLRAAGRACPQNERPLAAGGFPVDLPAGRLQRGTL